MRVYLALWREAERPTLSQERMGLRFKPPVSKGTVSKWESAEPGRLGEGVIQAYAEALGRHPSDMYRRPDQGRSLDALAAPLDMDAHKAIEELIAAMLRRAK